MHPARSCNSIAIPFNGSHAASKAAERSINNAARVELRARATLVTTVFASVIDTELAVGMDVPKVSPHSVVQQTLDCIEAGAEEVLCDDRARFIKNALPNDLSEIYPDIQSMWDSGGWSRPS
jgi:short-subunit dehydrogenase